MKRKNMRFFGVVLSAALVLQGAFAGNTISIKGAEKEETRSSVELSLPTGDLMSMEGIEKDIPESEIDYDCDEIYKSIQKSKNDDTLENQVKTVIHDSAVYEDEWDKYSNNYIYNQLSDEKKVVWETMDQLCLTALTTTKDYTTGYPTIGTVSTSAFSSLSELEEFIAMYKYSNPQYFFLSNRWYHGSRSPYTVSWCIYDNMISGSARKTCKEKFLSGIDSMKEKITYSTDEGLTVKSIHDVICENVVYNQTAVNTKHENEETEYTQSAYSTFTSGTTVCAGYALATELLCNDAGIDCIGVTSPGHAWNIVRVYNSWYNIDTTWADQGTDGIYYDFYLKSKTYYETDASNGSSHTIESSYNDYVPPCTLNSTSSGWTYGTVSKPTNTAKAPTFTLNKNDTISIASNETNGVVFYTTDESTPSSSTTRSFLYKSAIAIPDSRKIKAITVKNSYYDSKIVEKTVRKINYALNGGSNNSANPTAFFVDTAVITLQDPTYAKHVFDGWYLDSKFTPSSKLTVIDCSADRDFTIYAKWLPECKVTGKHTYTDSSCIATCVDCGEKINGGTHSFIDIYGNKTANCVNCNEPNPNYGYCGTDVTWEITTDDQGNQTLTIDGTGAMKNYNSSEKAPWHAIASASSSKLNAVIIKEGVTSIGSMAFYQCGKVETIELPESLTAIGENAFEQCNHPDLFLNIPCQLAISADAPSIFGDVDNWYKNVNHFCGTVVIAKGSKSEQYFDNKFQDSVNVDFVLDKSATHDVTGQEYVGGDAGEHYKACVKCDYHVAEKCKSSLSHSDYVAESCTTVGQKEYWECQRCDALYADEDATISMDENSIIIPAKNHLLQHFDKIDVTCTEAGCKEYWVCKNSGCEKIFAEEEAITETTLLALVINAIGHQWKDSYIVDKEATIEEAGSKSIHCSVCDLIKEGSSIEIPKLEVKKPVEEEKEKETPGGSNSGTAGGSNTTISSGQTVVQKTQTITIVKMKTYKASKLKKKKASFSLKARTSGNGKLTYKVTKGKSKYISVSKSGKVTLKKKCKKGTYKITITASATSKFKKASKVVVIKVK